MTTIETTLPIDLKRVADLLTSAFEGGSNYWYRIDEFIEPSEIQQHTDLGAVFRHIDYPLSPGGAVIVSDERKVSARVDLETIKRGLEVMRERYPRHFADWIAGNDDANTADVFLQCVCFGECVYG